MKRITLSLFTILFIVACNNNTNDEGTESSSTIPQTKSLAYTITNVYPDGAWQFEVTNTFVFNAFSTVSINPASDVTVQLAGTNLLTGKGSVVSLTPANGLVITGSSTNITVSAPLSTNMVYSAFIQVDDANGVPAGSTVKFDTVIPAYTFEGEDFNYGGGNFIDNAAAFGCCL